MQLLGTVIGGHRIVQICGSSGRFDVFRVEKAGPAQTLCRLYLLNDQLLRPELFHEIVYLIRSQWPFEVNGYRSVVLPEAQLWYRRPWFIVPESSATLASTNELTQPMVESLREQLRWLENLTWPNRGFSGPFAHGDVYQERILVLDPLRAAWIAPGWVAAADLASQRQLSRAKNEDATNFELLASACSFTQAGGSDCPICSKPLPSSLKFCHGCGRPLLGRRAARTPAVASPRAKPSAAHPDSDVPPRVGRDLGSGLRALFGRSRIPSSNERRDRGQRDTLETSACVAVDGASGAASCSGCGHVSAPGDRYCPNCGAYMSSSAAQ